MIALTYDTAFRWKVQPAKIQLPVLSTRSGEWRFIPRPATHGRNSWRNRSHIAPRRLLGRCTHQSAVGEESQGYPETSNFYCLPGRAGGTPIVLADEIVSAVDPCL